MVEFQQNKTFDNIIKVIVCKVSNNKRTKQVKEVVLQTDRQGLSIHSSSLSACLQKNIFH